MLEIEERISNLLKEEERKKGEKQEMLRRIQESIKERQDLCRTLEKEKQERIDRISKQKNALKRAKSIVDEQENEEFERKKESLRRDYTESIENVNELRLVFSDDMVETVKKILLIKKHAKTAGFSNLARAVGFHVDEQLRKFIVKTKELSTSLRVDKLIDLIKVLNKSIVLADDQYSDLKKRRRIYVESFFRDLEESFAHHFFGEFDTNRLDKPEWYLKYLITQLSEYEKIFLVLSQIDELEVETEDEEFERNSLKEYFGYFISKIYAHIIYNKLTECIYSSSKQKKELIMHHASEIGEFHRLMAERYSYEEKPGLSEKELLYIRNIFVAVTEEDLQKILKKEYRKWNDLFLYLLKKIFKQSAALHPIVPEAHVFLLEAAIRKYLEGVSAFLNSFLYKKEEEQKILVCFIEEIGHLEEDLLEIETEFGIAVGEVTILQVPYLGKFKKDMLDILQRILEERINDVMHPFASCRFMEAAEETEALSNLAEVVESLALLTESKALSGWVKNTAAEMVDEYVADTVLSAQIDNDSDAEKVKNIIKSIERIFIENNIQYLFKKTESRCKELFKE